MRARWRIVLVDEFQDTDPVQWQVLDRAFSGVATMVLIGDPKQAIYAFRGGDVTTYLAAAETAATRQTLDVNWRSDQGLLDAFQQLLVGSELGDPRIVVHPVDAHHDAGRLVGAPSPGHRSACGCCAAAPLASAARAPCPWPSPGRTSPMTWPSTFGACLPPAPPSTVARWSLATSR